MTALPPLIPYQSIFKRQMAPLSTILTTAASTLLETVIQHYTGRKGC